MLCTGSVQVVLTYLQILYPQLWVNAGTLAPHTKPNLVQPPKAVFTGLKIAFGGPRTAHAFFY